VDAPLYDVQNASKVFTKGGTEVRAVDGVSVTISAGEVVALEGPSGSGKTTLLQLLGALDRPGNGHILFEGRDLATLRDNDLAELRLRAFGFVFQHFNLIPTLTAVENVELALFGRGLSSSRRLARASILLDRVGLESRMHNRVTTLSGGERQRVAIARALANEPTLLLADEPTGSLDSANAALVADLLFKLRADPNMTIVLVTHNEELAARCPRLVRIKDGTIVEDVENANAASPVTHEPAA
jgi:putative ABC transport system ATP-binding protein